MARLAIPTCAGYRLVIFGISFIKCHCQIKRYLEVKERMPYSKQEAASINNPDFLRSPVYSIVHNLNFIKRLERLMNTKLVSNNCIFTLLGVEKAVASC